MEGIFWQPPAAGGACCCGDLFVKKRDEAVDNVNLLLVSSQVSPSKKNENGK